MSSFLADKQTLEDLNIPGRHRPHSIIGIFNQVKTHGGGRLLEEMFHQPLTDAEAINQRAGMFRYFQERGLTFPFTTELVGRMENFMGIGTGSQLVTTMASVARQRLLKGFIRDDRYDRLVDGFEATRTVLRGMRTLLALLDGFDDAKTLLQDARLNELLEEGTLSMMKLARYNHLLKHTLGGGMERLLATLYELDLYIAVSTVARTRGFSYAKMYPRADNFFRANELRHPGIQRGVGNPLKLTKESNMVFLTGANMAGKSTFMKSFGIAVYLAHMGFPVAASEMELSVRDGLFSSINVPDNLDLGYSHFYAEVLRVKRVAEEVSRAKYLVVLFDELFKGTNVKDAYDATLAVTRSFAGYRHCCFIISTHIIEVGEALDCGNVQFSYMPTVMEGVIARYPYRLADGITSDRHGMMIIQQEKILDIIRK